MLNIQQHVDYHPKQLSEGRELSGISLVFFFDLSVTLRLTDDAHFSHLDNNYQYLPPELRHLHYQKHTTYLSLVKPFYNESSRILTDKSSRCYHFE